MANLAERTDRVHVHIDLDVHDPSIAPANSYAAPDGLHPEDVHAILRHIAEHLGDAVGLGSRLRQQGPYA